VRGTQIVSSGTPSYGQSIRVERLTNKKSRKYVTKMGKRHYRPGQALRVPGVWGSRISRQLAFECGRIVSPTHRPPLPPGHIPGTHFC